MYLAIVALAASLGALLWLWSGWRSGRVAWPTRIGVAALMVAATWAWIAYAGAEIGVALMLETSALLAFGFILTRIEHRPGRVTPARTVAAPPAVKGARWRGAARVLVAGPLGLVAALGIAILIATRAPAAEQTRLILGGLLVPSLWAVAVGWTVASHRLPVQAATLAALGVLGFGSTFLGGI